jgi:hypothetical protein
VTITKDSFFKGSQGRTFFDVADDPAHHSKPFLISLIMKPGKAEWKNPKFIMTGPLWLESCENLSPTQK